MWKREKRWLPLEKEMERTEKRNKIFSIWNEMERVHFMVKIKYYRSNSVQTIMLFKILNDVIICILLDPWDKILIIKWTNRKILK